MYFRLVINVVLIIGCIVIVTGMIDGEVIQGKKWRLELCLSRSIERHSLFSLPIEKAIFAIFGLDDKMIKSTQKFVGKFESTQGR